jgi:hypothetical protein
MKKRDFIRNSLIAAGVFMIPKKAWPLEYYPTTGNVEWAILYGTWCGSSRDAGVWISEGMNGIANVFDVRENPDLSKYKHIVIGGSIRSGAVSKELQDFLNTQRETIKTRIRGLFLVCGNMMQPPNAELYERLIENHLRKLTGAEKVPSRIFLGRITWGLMEPDVQQQMKSMPGVEEYDNLKRSECMDFGKEVLKAAI